MTAALRVLVLAALAGTGVARDDDPVLVAGSQLPALAGRPLAEIAVFRYDPGTAGFVPIPYQIDERVDHAFNPGTGSEFHETMYDIFGEDDGRLDGDDELAFLFGDAGPEAPAEAAWVAGADATRYELDVHDPRPGAPVPVRKAYVFTGSSLPHAATGYLSWSGTSAGDVVSSTWSIDFSDRWVLGGFRVLPPCGTGSDLIDRVKGRAGPNLGLESEQEWNLASTYLGYRLGPVRAIRYVRGAASAVNTIHGDVIYRGFWERSVHLRVHPIGAIALYVDLLPAAGSSVFTTRTTAGATVDGLPDAGVSGAFVPWAVARTPAGGYVAQYDVPPSPHYAAKTFYYRDDLAYDDAVSVLYDDEDNSSYGAQGVQLSALDGSENDPIVLTYRFYPLCGGVGDAALGADYQTLRDQPLTVSAVPQSPIAGPVRTLRVIRAQADIALAWDAIPGADAYRVYASSFADLPQASWTLLGQPAAPSFTDAGGAGSGTPRFYSVVALTGTTEGTW